MNIGQKIIGTGLLFLFTIVTGVWLSNSGKPLNTMIFTVHKLLALAAVVFTVVFIRNLLKDVEINTNILALIIVSGLFILVLFVSGALLSIGNAPYVLVKTIHIIATIVAVVTSSLSIYLLVKK